MISRNLSTLEVKCNLHGTLCELLMCLVKAIVSDVRLHKLDLYKSAYILQLLSTVALNTITTSLDIKKIDMNINFATLLFKLKQKKKRKGAFNPAYRK